MTNLQQPYFLECNRSNSTILSTDDNYNAVWSSEISPFPLKPGDQVSVSSVAIEASSIGTPDTIEFTQNPVKVNNVQKDYVDNKVILEIGFYLINANGSHTCVLPLQFPYLYKGDVSNNKVAVNTSTTPFIGNPNMIGFSLKGTLDPAPIAPATKYVFYEGVDVNGNTLTTTTPTTLLTKIILSKAGDTNPAGYLLVNYSTDFAVNSNNFKAMAGMGLQTINGVNQNEVVDLGIVKHISDLNDRIVLELNQPALAPSLSQPTGTNDGSPLTFYVNFPNDNRGLGLMNADNNNYGTPNFKVERGNVLYEMTRNLIKWNTSGTTKSNWLQKL